MTTIKKYVIWSVLFSALIGLSGCGNSSSDIVTGLDLTTPSDIATVSDDVPVSDDATASDFSMILDVEESKVSGDWEALSSASGSDTLSASVVTQGDYGTCTVTDDSLAYLKTIETNETDTCELEISDGTDAVQVTVTVHSLFWKQMSEGDNHTSAIKSDGTLWSWGMNNDGQLGDGTMDESTTPVQESTEATDWISISSGGKHTAAIKSDGTLWSWGLNSYGQLGDGTRDSSMVPIQEIMLDTDWSSVRCGQGYSVGKKSNGETWRWGRRNTAPVANDQTVVTDENVAKAITLTGSDADNDPLTYTVVTGPSNGTLTGTAPNLTYTPNTDYDGPDSFTFKVNDGRVDSALATVSITVNPDVVVNTPPVADDQSVVTDENVAKAITLTGSDADNDPLTYAVVTNPINGTLTGTAPNLIYTPNADYIGVDSFTFTVNDGTVDSAAATVSITVNAGVIVNTPPVADDQSVVTDENVAKVITLTGSDADGDPLTYAVETNPSNGTLSGTAPNLIYTPNTDYTGADSFTFTVNDGTVDSAAATVSITVNAGVIVNTPPVADDQSVVTDENVAKVITLTGSDADGDPLTYAVETNPSNGTLSGTAPNLTYTPNTDYDGPDSFTFTVNDGTVDSAAATVSITVNSVNASDAVLAQIGLEADNPDVVNSVVTVAELNVILPVLTDITAGNETAYQDYIDANPDLFSEPATPGEVQAMIDAVNAAQATATSDAVLAQIGLEADTGDTVPSVVTVAQLNLILPALTNVDVANEAAYQDYIDENPDSFASPATPTEVQEMIDAVNAALSNQAPTASDFNMTLDVNESTVIGDWTTLSSANDADSDPLTALVKTQGTYGTCTVTDDSLAYLKTIETNATDTCALEISDGTETVQITVTINSLYWKQISAGAFHTIALKSDGTLWSWGYNIYGQLGDGTTTDSLVPVQEVTAATDWSSGSAGGTHTLALKSDGTLWAWGYNQYGQLGDGTTTQSLVPVQESTESTEWSSGSAGGTHTLALKSDGTLWAWGGNTNGQLGDGTTTQSLVPVQESTGATDWSAVSAGVSYTVALKSDGTLWAWGGNFVGQFGDGTTTNSLVPVQESTAATNWSAISTSLLGEAPRYTAALKSDGTLWAWGENLYGALGDGTTTNSLVPVQEATAATDWSAVSSGSVHTVALKSDGTLWQWGVGAEQLGDGTSTNSLVPVQEATAATNWSAVSTGGIHTVSLKSDGTLWAWGDNSYGQLGDGTTIESSIFVLSQPRQPAATEASDAVFAQIGAEGDSGDAVNSVVTVAQLGAILPRLTGIVPSNEAAYQDYIDANPDLFSSPATQAEVQAMVDAVNAAQGVNTAPTASDFNMTLDVDESTVIGDWPTLSSADDVDSDPLTALVKTQGTYGTCTVTDDSLAYLKTIETNATDTCELEISDDTETVQITVTINSLYWKQISAGGVHTTALKSDGTLWAWGHNGEGQLGDGTTTNSLVPVQETTAETDWISVSAGSAHTAALKSDGTLWAWGYNTYGALGDGTTTYSLVPVQEVTEATDWISVSTGTYHTAALKSNGTLWAWGRNPEGQLGNGTTTDSSVPVQEVTEATDWSFVSAGYTHTAALKSGGTLWTWGDNTEGQLGDGTTTDSLVPVQEVTEATDWSSVDTEYSNTAALKSGGTIWAWGRNTYGELGDGTTTDSLVPVQEVTEATDWSSVDTSTFHTAALKSDGTIWAWGRNAEGQLGDGTTTDSLVPVQEVTEATDWSAISTSCLTEAYDYNVALKSDGTLWAWGYNTYGELGDGTTVNKFEPTLSQPRQP